MAKKDHDDWIQITSEDIATESMPGSYSNSDTVTNTDDSDSNSNIDYEGNSDFSHLCTDEQDWVCIDD